MSAHNHRTIVPGCFRCDLGQDEARAAGIAQLREAATSIREHGGRAVGWEPAWDGDVAADKGWLAPVVGLLIANWLDYEANIAEVGDPSDEPFALAVARTYLGED